MKQLSDSIFKGVPLSIRSKVKLPELNIFYQQLQEHLCKTSRYVQHTHIQIQLTNYNVSKLLNKNQTFIPVISKINPK